MALVGFRSRNHPQQVARRGRLTNVDDRAITLELFAELERQFGPFTVDAAAAHHNNRCPIYWTETDDALRQNWGGHRVWCNPPYSDIRPWVQKAWDESGRAEAIVMLLPANRTEQRWWQDLVEPFRDRAESPLRTVNLSGRLRFLAPHESEVPPNSRPPFGCVLLIWTAVPHD